MTLVHFPLLAADQLLLELGWTLAIVSKALCVEIGKPLPNELQEIVPPNLTIRVVAIVHSMELLHGDGRVVVHLDCGGRCHIEPTTGFQRLKSIPISSDQ